MPILIYHHVADEEPTDFEQITLTVTTSQFEEELAYLQSEGYETVTLTDLFNALYYDLPLPAQPVVLTFDDGYADAHTEAFPLLQKYGFIGTFAVITGAVGTPGYLTWDQVQTMAAAGMEFVSHTVSHADLGSLAPEQATAELRDSKAALESALGGGQPGQFLVYPFGEPFAYGGAEAQQRIIELLRQEGYVGALITPLGNPPLLEQRADAPFQLNRIAVSGRESLARFAARLVGQDISP